MPAFCHAPPVGLQEELRPRNYLLDSKATQVWSYKSHAGVRAKAHSLAAEFLVAVEGNIKVGVLKMQCRSKDNVLQYAVPGTDVHGMVSVSEITATKSWEGAAQPEQTLHLPHLGLMIALYYRPAETEVVKDRSAERTKIRKAFRESVEPLLKLEPSAVVTDSAGGEEEN